MVAAAERNAKAALESAERMSAAARATEGRCSATGGGAGGGAKEMDAAVTEAVAEAVADADSRAEATPRVDRPCIDGGA